MSLRKEKMVEVLDGQLVEESRRPNRITQVGLGIIACSMTVAAGDIAVAMLEMPNSTEASIFEVAIATVGAGAVIAGLGKVVRALADHLPFRNHPSQPDSEIVQ
jgi:hypothetical protein